MFSRHHPNVANLKAEARRYRSRKAMHGQSVPHSRALELIAKRHGFCDWNTAVAHARTLPAPKPCSAGNAVSGRYMGHSFDASVVAASQLSPDETLVSLDLDEAVDVASSDRFSLPRTRVSGVIRGDGCSSERLSNGIPQLQLFSKEGAAR